MVPTPPLIGPVIQKERKSRKLTLEQLAAMSGVSKSMLSQIERGEANPTFAVLWSLTEALGIGFSDLISGGAVASEQGRIEIVSATHTPEIWSADRLCRLKILSPPRLAGHTEWYEIEIAPGGKLESAPHTSGAFEHFTAWTDGFLVTSGGASNALKNGETARYPADVTHAITNVSNKPARGLLVVLQP